MKHKHTPRRPVKRKSIHPVMLVVLLAVLSIGVLIGMRFPGGAGAAAPASLTFNGTNQFARGPNIPALTTYTVEAWVRRTTDNNNYQTFISDANSTYGSSMTVLFVDGGGSSCGAGDQFAFYEQRTNTTHCSGAPAGVNEWHHVAVTRDVTGTRRFFVDGRATSTQNSTPVPSDSSGRLTLGRAGDYNGEYFAGHIDAVRISNIPRYTTDFVPPITAFTTDANSILIWNIDENTGQTLTDASGNDRTALLGGATTVQNSDPRWSSMSQVDSIGSTPTPTGTASTPTPTISSPTPTSGIPTPTNTLSPTPTRAPTPTFTPTPTLPPPSGNNYSIRFFGNGRSDIDRIKIPINGSNRTADVGGDFTIEWWMKTQASNNTGSASCGANDGWITSNVMIDRDIYFDGDFGDYGIGLFNGNRIVFGVNRTGNGTTVCSTGVNVGDNAWHHIAVTRDSATGRLRIFIDGAQSGETTGPSGDISYRDNRSTNFPNSDPYIVLGAEKHDAGNEYPSYNGEMDELRISNTVRYTGNFTRPSSQFSADANTILLFRFNEGTGTTTGDASGNGNVGTLRLGGSPIGPVFVATTTPFTQ